MTRTVALHALRGIWFLLPLTVLNQAHEAVTEWNDAPRLVVVIGTWVLWAVGLAATAIALPSTLTLVRCLAPAGLVLAVWTGSATEFDSGVTFAIAHAALATVVSLSHLIGDVFVDGASYGDERRMLLRPQGLVLAVAVPTAWVCVVAGLVIGPLMLANGRWFAGTLATSVGALVVFVGARALYELTRRWVVFVPNGMVLHDHATLTEPVLFRRTAIERLGPAIVGSPARDLSGGAAGLLLECQLTDPAPLGIREHSRRSEHAAAITDVRRFLIAPTRPGALLDEAARRKLPVG